MPRRRRRPASGPTRWEQDNRLAVNPWPFVAFALVAAALVGLGVLIWWL